MSRDEIIAFLHDFKVRYGDRYGIVSLGVFGSVARGEIGPDSDVDIYVTTKTPDPFALAHVREDIESRLSRRVDVVRLRERMNPHLKRRIEEEGINV
jgi:hypothetical protein